MKIVLTNFHIVEKRQFPLTFPLPFHLTKYFYDVIIGYKQH